MKSIRCINAVMLLAVSARADLIDLADAQVKVTHTSGSHAIANAVDADDDTFWAGDDTDLTVLPANILISFPSPQAIARAEIVTQILKGWLRLEDIEVYAKAGDGWALLGQAQDNAELRFTVALQPALASVLRLRIRATHRPDHAWPRINEIRFFAPVDDAPLLTLLPAPVPEETQSERLFIDTVLGKLNQVQNTVYEPAKGYLWYVRQFADTMLSSGTDRYGAVHGPIFVSILDVDTREHPNALLPAIAGQRQADRAVFGGNLQHDVMLLVALEHLTSLTGNEKYRDGTGAYLRHFLTHCTDTASGLWPWGEHAHWEVYKDAPGHRTHEYLGAVPLSVWEQLWAINRDAVRREADGLLNHVVNLDTFDYNRHADISTPLPVPRPANMTFLDFPRHGGFYLQVWAFVYSKTGDEKYRDWCEKMMDKHVRTRHPQSGLLPSTTTRPNARHGLATQLSLAVTMLESVPLLGDTPTAHRCDKLANEYLEAMASLPHQPDEARYIVNCPVEGVDGLEELPYKTPGFEAHYGGGTYLGGTARLWAQAYRLTENRRYLDLAVGMARFYQRGNPSKDAHTRAKVFGGNCELMLDMYELTGEDEWLASAERYARDGIESLHADGMFRGATGLWYYESELWVSTLCHALVRLHAVLNQPDVAVPPNLFHR